MLRLAALSLALASACAGAPADAPAQPEPSEGQWLAPTELGYAEQQAWGMALPEGFGVIVLPPEVFAPACAGVRSSGIPEGGVCGPEVLGAADLDGAGILLRNDLTPAQVHEVLLHEMGHILRGQPGHLPAEEGCPERRNGAHVMCTWNGTAEVTAEDLAFVVAGRGPLGWL